MKRAPTHMLYKRVFESSLDYDLLSGFVRGKTWTLDGAGVTLRRSRSPADGSFTYVLEGPMRKRTAMDVFVRTFSSEIDQ